MKLRRIVKYTELAQVAPLLSSLHESLEGKWEPDLTREEFLESLLSNFNIDSYYFADLSSTGELIYFVSLLPQTGGKALFWLFYMNKDYRDTTKSLLEQVKQFLRQAGFTTVYTQSTRTSSSYERWLEKFGAEKLAIVYKFKL